MKQHEPRRGGWNLLARFRRDRSGAIAPLAAVVFTAGLIGVGAAIDISRLVTARTQLQDASDAADLALARMPANTTDAVMLSTAKAWVSANVTDPNIKNIVVNQPVRATGQVQLTVSASIRTTFSSLLGVTTLPINGHSLVQYGITQVELALVLDNTGSMNDDNKLSSLKSAATTLVNTLSQSAQASGLPNALKVAVVPFSMAVNVGATYQTASWMSGAMPAAYTTNAPNADAVDPSHPNRFTLLKNMNVAWGGCVESRPMPYDVQEDAPTTSNPATLFVPFFAPDEPDGGYYQYSGSVIYNYNSTSAGQADNPAWNKSPTYDGYKIDVFSENSYLTDSAADSSNNSSVGGVWVNHQNGPAKYKTAPASGTHAYWGTPIGPNAGCTVQALQRLTTNTTTVNNQINNMTASGDTEIPLGLMWGWHVLSPNAPFADGQAYGTPNLLKIIVLVTDGANTYNSSSNINLSHYTALGYAAQQRITSNTDAGSVQSALDSRLSTLCNNMKVQNADGSWRINIYTVPLEVTDPNIKSLLQGCVTDPANYLDTTSSSQLAATFANIAGSIQALRVAH